MWRSLIPMCDFARTTGDRAKTDTIDTRILAFFGARVKNEIRPIPDKKLCEIGVFSHAAAKLLRCFLQSTTGSASPTRISVRTLELIDRYSAIKIVIASFKEPILSFNAKANGQSF